MPRPETPLELAGVGVAQEAADGVLLTGFETDNLDFACQGSPSLDGGQATRKRDGGNDVFANAHGGIPLDPGW